MSAVNRTPKARVYREATEIDPCELKAGDLLRTAPGTNMRVKRASSYISHGSVYVDVYLEGLVWPVVIGGWERVTVMREVVPSAEA